jgi:hypothetical protein
MFSALQDFGRLGTFASGVSLPQLTGGVNPTLYADFTSGIYWYNGVSYASLAAWLTATSGTFTRASSASYTGSDGYLKSAGAASNALRFDNDPLTLASKGILIEGASTNLAVRTDLGDAIWGKINVTMTTSTMAGPDGLTSSATGTIDTGVATGDHGFYEPASSVLATVSGSVYAFSVYIKPLTGRYVSLVMGSNGSGTIWASATFDLQSLTVTQTVTGAGGGTHAAQTITRAANGFIRIAMMASINAIDAFAQVDFSNTGTPTLGNFGQLSWTANHETYGLFGFQFEQKPLPTSYIATPGGQVARAADNLTLALSPTAPNSMLAKFMAYGPVPNVTYRGVLSMDDNTSNNLNEMYINQNSGLRRADTYAAGVLRFDQTSGVIPANTLEKWMYASNVADYSWVFNGGAPITANTAGAWPTLTKVRIGDNFAGGTGGPLFGWLAQVGYWNARASNADMQRLTT